MQLTTIYLNEIDDRLEARYYIARQKTKEIFKEFNFIEIGAFASLTGGYTPSLKNFVKDYKPGETFPFIKSADVKKFQINSTDISYINKFAHTTLLKKSIIRTGDILIAMTGKDLGSVGNVYDDIKEGNINQNVVRIRITSEKIDPEYLLIILNSNFGQKQIQGQLTLTGQKYLNQIKIAEIKIPLIKTSIKSSVVQLVKTAQKYHVESLTKINQAKALFEEALHINYKEINEEKTYIVSSSDLSDILTPKFYYPKYLNTIRQMKKKFKTVKLGEIADIKRGNEVGSKNYRKYIDKKDSDIPFIRTSDLVNYEVDNYPDYYIDENIYKELKQDLKPNDLLVSNDGKIGLLAILTPEDKCITQSHIRRVRISKELNPYYILAFLTTDFGQYQFKQYSFTQATIPTISDRLVEIEIPLIDNQIRERISQLVKEAFQLKTEKKKLFREALIAVEKLLR